MHGRLVSDSFRRAAHDYRYLIEKRYARPSALKLVGDRYQLSSTQRSMLYRGVSSAAESADRLAKLTTEVGSVPLHIDGLNVLFTLSNYLFGKVLYLSTDGLLRDAAELHGSGLPSPKRRPALENAQRLLIEWLCRRRPSEIQLYLDEPVSLSGEMAAELRAALGREQLVGGAQTVRSADFVLKRVAEGVVATSDSTIIDACTCRVCDVARQILVERYAPLFVDLRKLLAE